jgi:hypothetical protein
MLEKQHGRAHFASLNEVEGFALALEMQSHVTPEGKLRLTPISGVEYRLASPLLIIMVT